MFDTTPPAMTKSQVIAVNICQIMYALQIQLLALKQQLRQYQRRVWRSSCEANSQIRLICHHLATTLHN